jgi:hypothetical protein
MWIRYAVFASMMLVQFSVPAAAPAREMAMSRRDIREMPIMQRPSRPGHFYGNTVRRRNG